jgi:hypothetical protein
MIRKRRLQLFMDIHSGQADNDEYPIL